ncbi:hypothetical protein C0993_005980 [Termitomyces sp. T159_Od127]|nr:hypothetical protein C0993_005980 [Termitomyces sp. T159_Od127]
MTGVTSKPLDYAIIGFKGLLRKKPRPELMEIVKNKLLHVSEGKLDVDWNIAQGYDKARMIWFRDDEKIGLNKLKEGLEKQMKERHIEYQACTSSGDTVRFHLLDKNHITALERNPPTIWGKQYLAHTPKYIQPNYALEIGIVGVEMFDDPEYYIGNYIERTYHRFASCGPAIRQQRLELNCTVYCVVVENREIAEKILDDPFPMFDQCNPKPSRPQYLYYLNQHGYPTSWQRSSNANDQRLERRRWDNFEDRTNQCASAIDTLAKQIKVMQDRQQEQAYQNQCTMGAMLQTMRLMGDKSQAQQELRILKREYISARRSLMSAQAQKLSQKEIDFKKQETRDLAGEIEDLERQVKDAEEKTSAFQAIAFPALLPASSFVADHPGDVSMEDSHNLSLPESSNPTSPPGLINPQSPQQSGDLCTEDVQAASILTSFASGQPQG